MRMGEEGRGFNTEKRGSERVKEWKSKKVEEKPKAGTMYRAPTGRNSRGERGKFLMLERRSSPFPVKITGTQKARTNLGWGTLKFMRRST